MKENTVGSVEEQSHRASNYIPSVWRNELPFKRVNGGNSLIKGRLDNIQITCYSYWRALSKWTTGRPPFSMILGGMTFSIAGEWASGFVFPWCVEFRSVSVVSVAPGADFFFLPGVGHL